MHALNKATLLFALGLAALAGYVDAIGFLEMGRVFVSFMSGNSTQLAVAWVKDDGGRVVLLAQIIACFVGGAALGTVAGHIVREENRAFAVLVLVAALLASAASCYAMGMPILAILCCHSDGR